MKIRFIKRGESHQFTSAINITFPWFGVGVNWRTRYCNDIFFISAFGYWLVIEKTPQNNIVENSNVNQHDKG